jgi:KDO2-lipid IV(A) lauroyltransferase
VSLSFTRFKDRIWSTFDAGLRRLPGTPVPLQNIAYGILGGLFRLAYRIPGGPLAETSRAFARVLGRDDPARMHREFTTGFLLGLRRMEMLRLGQTTALDAMLEIPDRARLEMTLAEGKGAVLIMPHCHASIAMVRGLAARYPTLMLVRESKKDSRAKAQRSYYAHLGCPCIDVRRTPDAAVARAVLKALRQGSVVVGVVDRIQAPPPADAPLDKARDMVRVTAFGEPVGMVGWPLRFAARPGSPILPAMVRQTDSAIILDLGPAMVPGADLQASTQSLATALEEFIRMSPRDWLFVYDKQWRRILRRAATRLGTPGHDR